MVQQPRDKPAPSAEGTGWSGRVVATNQSSKVSGEVQPRYSALSYHPDGVKRVAHSHIICVEACRRDQLEEAEQRVVERVGPIGSTREGHEAALTLDRIALDAQLYVGILVHHGLRQYR